MLCQILFCGLQFPLVTCVIAGIYLITRIGFTISYFKFGAPARVKFAIVMLLIQMMFPIYTVVAMWQLAVSDEPKNLTS